MMTVIEGISFELDESGVSIEQHDGCGNPVDAIYLHRVLLAHLAAKMGIVDKSAGDAALRRENTTLKRRLGVLHDRIGRLDSMLALCGHHEDLAQEQAFSSATWELSAEFVTEMSAPDADNLRTDTGHQGTGSAGTVTSPLANSVGAASKGLANGQQSDSKPHGKAMANAIGQLDLEPTTC